MGKRGNISGTDAGSIRLRFRYRGVACEETIRLAPTSRNLAYVTNLRGRILDEIARGQFDYHAHFPTSKRALLFAKSAASVATVGARLEAWLETARATLERSTLIGYERAIARTLVPAFGSTLLRDLSRAQIREWIAAQTTTAKRINNVLTPLRQMLAEAVADGAIATNPVAGVMVKRRGPREDDVDPFTPIERAAILGALDGQLRNLADFAFWTGLRTSELIALRWQDIDWTHGLVLVRQARVAGEIKGPKTTAGRRDVKLLAGALAALRAQKAHTLLQGGFVFHDPRTGEAWAGDKPFREWHWRPALVRAGVRYRYPYQTRHTYASTMLSAGENPMWVAKQMGHRDWIMIVRTYGRWIPEIDPNAGGKGEASLAATTNVKKENGA